MISKILTITLAITFCLTYINFTVQVIKHLPQESKEILIAVARGLK
jgi:hypothetical protein